MSRQKAERSGRLAETIALLMLLLKGYWPVAVRAKTPKGEIDLIVRRFRTLVLVEVKQRATLVSGNESISAHQQQRIMDGFSWWLARNPAYAGFNTRMDAVLLAPKHFPQHIENAFHA